MSEDPKPYQPTVCDTCPAPGACCRKFALSHWFADDMDIEEQWEPYRQFYPFNPIGPHYRADRVRQLVDGTSRSIWFFSCPKLGADGRCTIYAGRPETCRRFQPMSDKLCALYKLPVEEAILT